MVVKSLTGGGETFTGRNSKEVVLKMSRADFLAQGKTSYVKAVKDRLWYLYDVKIRCRLNDWEKFLKELEKHEFIEIEA